MTEEVRTGDVVKLLCGDGVFRGELATIEAVSGDDLIISYRSHSPGLLARRKISTVQPMLRVVQ
jgi:hypothetical protein